MLTEQELKVLILRKEGLRQAEIARRLGITQGAVSRFEANAKAKITQAKKELAALQRLGIDTDDNDIASKAMRIQQDLQTTRRRR